MIRKITFALLALCWLVHPGFSAAAVAHQHAAHPHQHATSKKHSQRVVHKKASSVVNQKKVSNKKSTRKKYLANKRAPIPNVRTDSMEPPINQITESHSGFPFHFFSSVEHRLVDFVHKTVGTLKYSVYKLGGTHFDAKHGVYIVDCSDYVDNLLQTVHPDAFSNLVDTMRAEKPTTQHYYDFFRDLAVAPNDYWQKVDSVENLEAGDILVFRYKNGLHHQAGGHVMVVMDKPIQDEDGFLVKVADSARVGHSEDTRGRHVSGIGIGTLVLKTHPDTGRPFAYAWRIGARWNSNVNIAMARPIAGSHH
jgi:hypothetical protein